MLEPEHVFNGRYRIDGRLGAGGMAIVYSGTDLLLRRRVAIKVLRDQYVSDDEFVRRFSYEAQAAAKLSHPNIVNVYDFGHEGDAHFIVMELVEGETLADILSDAHTVPESVAIDYATQIAAGLAFAHRQGLLHRDVKPANILVTRDDVVKISDFGIARAAAENIAGVTQPGMVMGSVAYISPEQAQGRDLDERADLYSLGVVLFQMVTGAVPFAAETPVAVALKHVSEPVPNVDPVRHGISPALATIIERLLQKDPADRFRSATDLASALRQAREQPANPAPAARPSAPLPPPRPSAAPDRPVAPGAPAPAGRTVRQIALFALLFVAAVAVGFFITSALAPPRNTPVGSYAGRSSSIAQQELAAAGLRAEIRTLVDATVPVDRVVRQDPPPGSLIARGDAVALYVSSGAPVVAVPDVAGFTRPDAERALASAKLVARIVRRFNAAPKETVVEIRPAAGQPAPEGSEVTLTVSDGPTPVSVPQLVGRSLDDARAALGKLGLKLSVDQETPNDLIAGGTVTSQSVAPDTRLATGATVGVAVSSGPQTTTVPDIGGKPLGDAQALILAAGFTPRVVYLVGTSSTAGTVSAQDPVAGTTAARHSSVTISVAVPGTVPDVAGLSLDDARRILTNGGYTIGSVLSTPDGNDGRAVRTDPAAGTVLRPGETVNLLYHPAGGR